MTKNKFQFIVNHVWKFRAFLRYLPEFDYPFYGGLKSQMGTCSPESVDAMQNIWESLFDGSIKNKRELAARYSKELSKVGELVK